MRHVTKEDHLWIQKAIKHHGRVHRYVHHLYGAKAFMIHHYRLVIRYKYLIMAKKRAEQAHNRGLVDAVDLAIRLRRFHKA